MESKIKHLEFIQGIINRLSTNSFLLKGWSVVLVSALLVLSANNSHVNFVILAFIPTIMFWGLDGYFLLLQRVYRKHYDRIRQKADDDIDFSMDTSDIPRGFNELVSATFSKTLVPFHCSLTGAIIVVMFIQF